MPLAQKTNLALTATSFKHNEYIPKQHSCEGEDLSPELSWRGAPAGTKSFALIVDDPDAPNPDKPLGAWLHWTIYDLPAAAASLEKGLPKTETLANGAKQGVVWGFKESDYNRVGYGGPCPPPGKPHRYFFKLYALDKMLDLAPKATKSQILKAMEGHVLAQTELIGLYKR